MNDLNRPRQQELPDATAARDEFSRAQQQLRRPAAGPTARADDDRPVLLTWEGGAVPRDVLPPSVPNLLKPKVQPAPDAGPVAEGPLLHSGRGCGHGPGDSHQRRSREDLGHRQTSLSEI